MKSRPVEENKASQLLRLTLNVSRLTSPAYRLIVPCERLDADGHCVIPY